MRPEKHKKSRTKLLQNGADTVFDLLLHHPHFKEGVVDLVKKYRDRKSKSGKRLVRLENISKLLDDFNIPKELRNSLLLKTENYILTGKEYLPKQQEYQLSILPGTIVEILRVKPEYHYI